MIHLIFRRLLPLFALLLVLWIHLSIMNSSALACPTCKAAQGNDPYAAQMIQGYFWSIVFMMSMPFLILGSLSTYFYLLVRKARTQQQIALPSV